MKNSYLGIDVGSVTTKCAVLDDNAELVTSFYLPPQVAELVRQGVELGEADDIVFGQSNSKQASGAVGLLTGDVIDRAGLYEGAVILALIPFKNRQLY